MIALALALVAATPAPATAPVDPARGYLAYVIGRCSYHYTGERRETDRVSLIRQTDARTYGYLLSLYARGRRDGLRDLPSEADCRRVIGEAMAAVDGN